MRRKSGFASMRKVDPREAAGRNAARKAREDERTRKALAGPTRIGRKKKQRRDKYQANAGKARASIKRQKKLPEILPSIVYAVKIEINQARCRGYRHLAVFVPAGHPDFVRRHVLEGVDVIHCPHMVIGETIRVMETRFLTCPHIRRMLDAA